MFDWLHQVIPLITQKPFILMGHSMGAAIATVYTATYSKLITSLIIIDNLGPLSLDVMHHDPALAKSIKKNANGFCLCLQ